MAARMIVSRQSEALKLSAKPESTTRKVRTTNQHSVEEPSLKRTHDFAYLLETADCKVHSKELRLDPEPLHTARSTGTHNNCQ